MQSTNNVIKKNAHMKYKHLFFDLDRTIWDFDRNALITFQEIYQKYNLKELGVKYFEEFFSKYKFHNNELWALYRKAEIKKEVLSVKRFELTLKDFGIDDQSLAEKIAYDYITLSPLKTGLFPHVYEVLNYLSEKYKLHIITNGFEEVQYKKIEVSDLNKYFENIITSEEAGTKKPEKQIFEFSLSKASAKPDESLMIGDDIAVDIIGAKTIGIDQVFVNYDRIPHDEEITYEINDLIELKAFL
jgi:putative hydrolase of the HAD superfamily